MSYRIIITRTDGLDIELVAPKEPWQWRKFLAVAPAPEQERPSITYVPLELVESFTCDLMHTA